MLQEQNVRKGFFEHDEFVVLRAALATRICKRRPNAMQEAVS
jgi:hypothetical protein